MAFRARSSSLTCLPNTRSRACREPLHTGDCEYGWGFDMCCGSVLRRQGRLRSTICAQERLETAWYRTDRRGRVRKETRGSFTPTRALKRTCASLNEVRDDETKLNLLFSRHPAYLQINRFSQPSQTSDHAWDTIFARRFLRHAASAP